MAININIYLYWASSRANVKKCIGKHGVPSFNHQ